VQNVPVAQVIIDASIVAKLQSKHNPLTADEVREALVYGRYSSSGWDDDEVHGLRLVVTTTTLGGVEFTAYLMPLNPNDPEEGTFVLKTAIPKQ
jgi:hypothetical protein